MLAGPDHHGSAPARINLHPVSRSSRARARHGIPIRLGRPCTSRKVIGRFQTKGGPIHEIRPGDVVWIPPGEKALAWRFADQWHDPLAMQEAQDGITSNWMEQVTDAEYSKDVG